MEPSEKLEVNPLGVTINVSVAFSFIVKSYLRFSNSATILTFSVSKTSIFFSKYSTLFLRLSFLCSYFLAQVMTVQTIIAELASIELMEVFTLFRMTLDALTYITVLLLAYISDMLISAQNAKFTIPLLKESTDITASHFHFLISQLCNFCIF